MDATNVVVIALSVVVRVAVVQVHVPSVALTIVVLGRRPKVMVNVFPANFYENTGNLTYFLKDSLNSNTEIYRYCGAD